MDSSRFLNIPILSDRSALWYWAPLLQHSAMRYAASTSTTVLSDTASDFSTATDVAHSDGIKTTPPIPFEELTDIDVICGRTRLAHSHTGNKRFRDIVQQFREEYQNASHRDQKGCIVNHIILKIEGMGGRFLKKADEDDELWWCVMEDMQAYEKVSHALRSARAPQAIDKIRSNKPDARKKS